jgi:hypothetical protein
VAILATVPIPLSNGISSNDRHQPAELNAQTLLNRIDLPLEWPAQLKAIGID